MARMARAVGFGLLVFASAAGAAKYRVTLVLMPGDDAAAVAAQLEATYGMQFVRVGEGPSAEWTVATSESRARLLSADPQKVVKEMFF